MTGDNHQPTGPEPATARYSEPFEFLRRIFHGEDVELCPDPERPSLSWSCSGSFQVSIRTDEPWPEGVTVEGDFRIFCGDPRFTDISDPLARLSVGLTSRLRVEPSARPGWALLRNEDERLVEVPADAAPGMFREFNALVAEMRKESGRGARHGSPTRERKRRCNPFILP